MYTIEMFFPNWKNLSIHESSPAHRGASLRLSKECPNYIPSQLFENAKLGGIVNGVRCENLESLTFSDEELDLHITQDVMEHVADPAKAFQEIARTTKPGGAHIFSVPLVQKNNLSQTRKNLPHLYHGNPISGKSLVTTDWGFDICKYIFKETGLFTQIVLINDIDYGIKGEYIEILVTFK